MKITVHYIDDRAGCIAIRDSRVEQQSPGLHHDTPGVVWFKSRPRIVEKCPTCGHKTSRWPSDEEDDETMREAIVEIKRLDLEYQEKEN